METVLIVSAIVSISLAAFAVYDLRKQAKKREEKTVFYCNMCEQLNTQDCCPHCGKENCAKMPWGKAFDMISQINAERMAMWNYSSRVMPEVE